MRVARYSYKPIMAGSRYKLPAIIYRLLADLEESF